MKLHLSNNANAISSLLACLALIAAAPLSAAAYDDVKQVKVKDHKVKVKMVNGKAKIKEKPYGKTKIKVKGPNGDIAAAIASEAAGHSHSGHRNVSGGYGYSK